MRMHQQQIQKELLQAGATQVEAKDLQYLASQLKVLQKDTKITGTTVHEKKVTHRIIVPATFAALGLVLGMFLISLSESALPTSWFYHIQALSDTVAIAVYPPYEANVMMKRAEQVNMLVVHHANSQTILATLADYTHEARAYQSTARINYAAFAYCKANLLQAAAQATPAERQAILERVKVIETS